MLTYASNGAEGEWTKMRKLVVSEWISLDGVYDADTMEKWWAPFQSADRAQHIKDVIGACGAIVLGFRRFEARFNASGVLPP